MDPETRRQIARHGLSVWLRAELDVLLRRVLRRSNRPLLKQGDPRQTMERLMRERYPVYAEAAIIVDSGDGPHDAVVDAVIAALAARPRAGTRAKPLEAPR
jgi:shikimate kinase